MEGPAFTEAEYRIFESYQKVVARTWTFAVDWNGQTKRLEHTSSKWKRATTLVYVVSCVLMALHAGIGLRDLLRAVSDSGGSGDILHHGFQFGYTFIFPSWVIVLFWNLDFWRRRDKNVHAFNELLAYGRKNGLGSRSTKRAKYFGYFQMVYWAAITSGVFAAGIVELGMLLSTKNIMKVPVVLLTPLHVYISGVLQGVYQVVVYAFLIICKDQLTLTPNQNLLTSPPAALFRATQNYRTLMLLSSLFNQSVCQGFIPITKYALCGLGMILFALGLRIHPSSVPEIVVKAGCFLMPLYMWGAAILAANMMSSVWDLGRAYLQNLEHRARASAEIDAEYKKLLVRIVRSLSPVRVDIGGLYCMQRQAKLTLIDFIAAGTVNMLLMVSNK